MLMPAFWFLLLQLFKELWKSDSTDYVGCLQPAAEDAMAVSTPTANGTGAQHDPGIAARLRTGGLLQRSALPRWGLLCFSPHHGHSLGRRQPSGGQHWWGGWQQGQAHACLHPQQAALHIAPQAAAAGTDI